MSIYSNFPKSSSENLEAAPIHPSICFATFQKSFLLPSLTNACDDNHHCLFLRSSGTRAVRRVHCAALRGRRCPGRLRRSSNQRRRRITTDEEGCRVGVGDRPISIFCSFCLSAAFPFRIKCTSYSDWRSHEVTVSL